MSSNAITHGCLAPEFRSCAQSFNGGVKTGKRVQERVCGRDWLQRRRRRSHHKSESAGRWGGSGSERRGGLRLGKFSID